jgi:putative ABC transport system permease protein
MRRFVARLWALFRRHRAEDDLSREMSAHLALLEDEYRRRGLMPDEARLAARRAMGSVALAKDLHRDARSFVWLEDLRRDLRHAARALRRNPGFTLLAVFALGLGIGVNTAFFTIVDAICLRGLPIDDPDRVMFVSARDAQDRPLNFSYAEFDEMRQRATAFQRVAAYTNTIASVADDRQPPARVLGAYVSAGAFELIGHRPLLGRTFRADEDNPGAPAVVIIGSELWSSRYASDPGIVGQTITVNGVPSTVIGVMARGFMFPANADLWRPMANLPAAVRESRAERRLAVFARLADGATEEQSRVDMASLGEGWSREWPATNRDVRTRVVPINEQLNPSVAQRTWIAFIVAGALVLLVACANVANLLLMRAATRGREMAIRTSIGASRGRVVRQLLVESATLSALAGGFGVFVAWGGLRMLSSIIPPEAMPYWMAFTMNGRVLAMLLGVCLLCVFLCGMPSALHVSKMDVRDTLTDGGTTTAARPARRWIAALLAAEFAVTLVLVAMGVMSMRAGAETRRTEFQVDPASLMTMWVTLPSDAYRNPAARAAFFDRVVEAVGGSASAGSVAYASALPNSGGGQQPLIISGRSAEKPPLVWVVSASEEYFAVLRVPLVRGRAFTLFDGRPGSEAAIVNERFVRMFLGNQEPIGARIRVGAGETPWLQIVGVATTVRQQQLTGPEPDPVVFVPFRPAPPGTTAIVVRSADQDATIVRVRQEIARIDPNLPVYRIMSYEQAVRNAAWNSRLSDVTIKSIAVIALLLALVGLYAVTSHTVEGWRRELGMRIALGASAGHIGWLVLRRVLTQLAVGLALGLVGALAFDRTFNDPANRGATGVSMTDPGALLLILLAMCAVAVVACLVPIRRAARVDPLVALRAE